MKQYRIIREIILVVTLSLAFLAPASSMDAPGFAITRMVVCEKIDAQEPVSPGEIFAADIEKVYCFLEARDIEHDIMISFVWYFADREMARVALPLQQGKRWRTFSSKKLARLKGNWRVELQEASGHVLNTVSFQVQ